jgi:DNA-binding XRE family transcriptional regulator
MGKTRFTLCSAQDENKLIATDTINDVVMKFQAHAYNTTQEVHVINESDFASVDGALRLATCLRELSEWLYQEHREILFPDKEQARRSLGERIKRLRTEQGFTQEQLAERVGITKSNICNIEAGKYSVGFDILYKIATALGTKLELNKYE